MIVEESITIGTTQAEGMMMPQLAGADHANLIVIRCARGFLMCGYLSLEKAEQLGDAAVRVAGASFEDVLANKITGMTPQARELGVTDEMTGEQAALILNS
ncbi:MAG: DUF1805 domain-containing protein [Atopobiaceae bacterium]|jgi:uncharacterized protein YunC (DUF1805 family)